MENAERTQRKPRSEKEIAEQKAAQEAKLAARAQQKAEQAARWEADYPQRAARYQRQHDARLKHEKVRAGKRKIQNAGILWSFGYDTPETRWIAKYVLSIEKAEKEMRHRAKLAGDPLNLTGHTPKPSKKQQKRQAEVERLARGERVLIIPDNENPNQNVIIATMPHSLRRVKQLKVHHEPAAEKFLRDWEMAGYTGLSSPGFDPRVDTSAKATAGHLRAAEAQKRLLMVEAHIGLRNFEICKGVLIFNITPTVAHRMGGRDHRSISNDIEVALNALTGFYDPVRLDRDPTWRAFQRVLEIGLGVIAQGEEEVR